LAVWVIDQLSEESDWIGKSPVLSNWRDWYTIHCPTFIPCANISGQTGVCILDMYVRSGVCGSSQIPGYVPPFSKALSE
jgi:hypothetical protein